MSECRTGINLRSGSARFRALAAEELAAEGNTILGSQVYVRTFLGVRIIDHLILTPAGKIVAVEVKSGNAIRDAFQAAKDVELATQGGVFFGKNAPEALRGQRMVIDTIVRVVQ